MEVVGYMEWARLGGCPMLAIGAFICNQCAEMIILSDTALVLHASF